ASHRNRRAIRDGKVQLEQGTVPHLPFDEASFDAVYSVNCAQFWSDLEQGLGAVERVLRVGGRAAIAVQPKHRDASRADSERWLDTLSSAAKQTGLTVDARELGPEPVPTAAVVFRKES